MTTNNYIAQLEEEAFCLRDRLNNIFDELTDRLHESCVACKNGEDHFYNEEHGVYYYLNESRQTMR